MLSFIIMLLGSFSSTLWFEKFTPEGVERVVFWSGKNYTWQEAESFALKSSFDNILILEVTMKDGTKHSFNGGFFRAIEFYSDDFEEEFTDSKEYMIWLSKEFRNREVPMEMKKKEKLLKQLDKDGGYWRKVAEEIIATYEERNIEK